MGAPVTPFVVANPLGAGSARKGLQSLSERYRMEIVNNSSFLGVRYPLGPVPRDFSKGFVSCIGFRGDSPHCVSRIFPNRSPLCTHMTMHRDRVTGGMWETD